MKLRTPIGIPTQLLSYHVMAPPGLPRIPGNTSFMPFFIDREYELYPTIIEGITTMRILQIFFQDFFSIKYYRFRSTNSNGSRIFYIIFSFK